YRYAVFLRRFIFSTIFYAKKHLLVFLSYRDRENSFVTEKKQKNSPPTFSIDGERISQNPSWSFTNINSP
ncbi:MAG: hypothetical protein MJZ30_00890, partial [Paludibacteraceae bacterium]|nr:hypothetical protein [Paludibacteraceae bacterium]